MHYDIHVITDAGETTLITGPLQASTPQNALREAARVYPSYVFPHDTRKYLVLPTTEDGRSYNANGAPCVFKLEYEEAPIIVRQAGL